MRASSSKITIPSRNGFSSNIASTNTVRAFACLCVWTSCSGHRERKYNEGSKNKNENRESSYLIVFQGFSILHREHSISVCMECVHHEFFSYISMVNAFMVIHFYFSEDRNHHGLLIVFFHFSFYFFRSRFFFAHSIKCPGIVENV